MSKSRKNRKSRKNTGRGRNVSLPPLRNTTRTASSRNIRSIRQLKEVSQSARSTRKNVRINTPENIIQEYSLGSSEKDYKRASPIRGIPTCKNPKRASDFPCKKKRTVFRTKKQYEAYKDLLESRNESTGYKSRSEHYDDIESMLMYQGSDLLRK